VGEDCDYREWGKSSPEQVDRAFKKVRSIFQKKVGDRGLSGHTEQ
jgi:hypothetical protein